MESFEERWARARDQTVLHRTRKSDLYTFGTTALPYVFIGSSAINSGDTVMRKGEIKTEKPALFLGGQESPNARFNGFEDEGEEQQDPLLLARAFRFPNLQVHNKDMTMEVVERELNEMSEILQRDLELGRDRRTAVIEGPEDLWGLSLLIYAGEMTQRSAPGNVRDMLERGGGSPLF